MIVETFGNGTKDVYLLTTCFCNLRREFPIINNLFQKKKPKLIVNLEILEILLNLEKLSF